MCLWRRPALTDIKHPMQRAMQARINLLLARVEEAGKDGIEESELEQLFLVNGFGEPRLVRKYLNILTEFGKVKKEGTRFYSRNFPERGDSRQQRWEEIEEDPAQTHTHTSSGGGAS